MAGGTKPAPRTRKAEKFQDGGKKSGGIGTAKHAGPKRASKTPPRGTKGSQLQRRERRHGPAPSIARDGGSSRSNPCKELACISTGGEPGGKVRTKSASAFMPCAAACGKQRL